MQLLNFRWNEGGYRSKIPNASLVALTVLSSVRFNGRTVAETGTWRRRHL